MEKPTPREPTRYPLNGTRAQVTTEIQGRFWAIPQSLPWLPVDYEGESQIIMMLAQAILSGYALCDTCATTDCSSTGTGKILGTYRSDPVKLRVGTSEAHLESSRAAATCTLSFSLTPTVHDTLNCTECSIHPTLHATSCRNAWRSGPAPRSATR